MKKLPLGKIIWGLVAAFVIFVLTSLGLDLNEQQIALNEALQILESQSWVIQELSGTVNELTIIEEPKAELTTETGIEEVPATVLACSPGEQPTQAAGNWTGNSEILNTRASKHLCILPQGTYNTITFTFAKPLASENQLHAWFKDTGIYGRLLIEKWATSATFYLNELETNKGTFDLFKSLVKNDVTVSTYLATFDWNYIVEVNLD